MSEDQMIKKILIVVLAVSLSISLMAADDIAEEKKAVMKTVEDAYVKGIHINRDPDAIRKGFHEDFIMFVNREGKISKVTRDGWIARIEEGNAKNPNRPKPEVKHNFAQVDVTDNAASVKIELHKNGKHVFTDYMSLYKFEDGWKIIGKIFQSHR